MRTQNVVSDSKKAEIAFESIWTKGNETSSAKNALTHFNNHGKDFESKNAVDYVKQTKEFLVDSSKKSNVEFKMYTNKNKETTVRVFDKVNDTFASYKFNNTLKSFTPKTMFKPNPLEHGFKSNLDYWNYKPGEIVKFQKIIK